MKPQLKARVGLEMNNMVALSCCSLAKVDEVVADASRVVFVRLRASLTNKTLLWKTKRLVALITHHSMDSVIALDLLLASSFVS